MKLRLMTLTVLAVAVSAAGCTITDTKAPPLSGPSEMGLSLTITASPEVLSLDGASVSRIRVEARDRDGQLLKMDNRARLRVEILADGVATDFGTLSSREIETNGNGIAEVTYTAPMYVSGAIPTVNISLTPMGAYANGDAANLVRRVIAIRLVPPGVIGNAPTPSFTFTPANPSAFQTVRFDGSGSTPGLGAIITSYVWDFGDDTSGTGVTANHQYNLPGTYFARLTVTDSNGFSATSATQAVTVGAGSAPLADFVFSPTTPSVNGTIFFNATSSAPGTGHQIVRYDWDFGDGTRRSGSLVSKSYTRAGTYNVVLTVTDEVGQTGQTIKQVVVGGGTAPSVDFVFSPTAPDINASISFNGSPSTPGAGHRIVRYEWDFGDGSARQTGVTVTKAYATAGTYNVILTVTDEIGQTGQAIKAVTVGATPATASFTFNPTNPTTASNIVFNASASRGEGGNPIVSYVWNFGCTAGTNCLSASGTGVAPTNTYTVAGTYAVTLTITDSAGRTATTTQNITVAP